APPRRRVVALSDVSVSGEGLRAAKLRATDFVAQGPVWRAEVSLVAGWSAEIEVGDEAGARLPGIVLALDGVPLAATDEHGTVVVERKTKPARVSIVTPGWELV